MKIEAESRVSEGLALPLMEAFYTIQGEGVYSGQAAYFIRLGGCDVGCVWCDVKDSWEAGKWPLVEIDEIVAQASAYPARLAVITGGEPLMYELGPLTRRLKKVGFKINMETSGAHPYSGDLDWTCLSPKKFKAPVPEMYAKADELKVVVFNKSDLDFALKEASKVTPSCHLLLQPEWSKAAQMMPFIVDFVKENPRWRVSLQTHKFMEIP